MLLATPSFAADPTPPPAGDPALREAIAGVEAYYAHVTNFKATFSQEVRRAHVPRPLKKSGTVYYIRPGKMRWDYTQPDKVYYISDGDVLWSYEVATRQAIKMSVRNSELYDSLRFLFGDGKLEDSFTIRLGADRDGLRPLILTPRAGQQNYKTLTLWARPGTWEVARTELVDPLDNVSSIVFSNVSSEPLKPDAFRFTPPKGAQIQDLTRDASPNP